MPRNQPAEKVAAPQRVDVAGDPVGRTADFSASVAFADTEFLLAVLQLARAEVVLTSRIPAPTVVSPL